MKRRKIKKRYHKSKNALIIVTLISLVIAIPTFFLLLKDIVTTKAASNNSLGKWISLGLNSILVGAIATTPDYASNQTLFVNTSEGIFKSTNAGSTWTKLIMNDNPPGYSPYSSSIAISPNYAVDKTILANTSNNFTSIYRSQDRGSSWELINIGQEPLVLSEIAFSPNYKNDKTIFIGGNDFIGMSTNNGSSWQVTNLLNYTITDFAFSPNYSTNQTIYATVSISPGENQQQINGLFKSTDKGVTWNLLNIPYEADPFSIALSPNFTQDNTIFVGTGSVDGSHHLIKSIDGGSTWQAASTGIPQTDVQEIVISPDSSIIYAGTGGDGAYISTNFGNSWQIINNFPVNDTCSGFTSFALSPQHITDKTLFAGCVISNTGNESGVWKHVFSKPNTDNPVLLAPFNNGVTWTVSQGYFNNRNQTSTGCHVGTGPDHCRNQLFGLDLVPGQQSDTDILASGNGIVAFRGKLEEEDCIGLRIILDNGLNMNVCHFASFNVSKGERVLRGKVLGIRSSPHVHLSLDDRYRIGTLCPGKERCFLPVPFDGERTIEGMSFPPNPNGETVLLPYPLCEQRKIDCQFNVDFQQYKGTSGTSTNVAIP